MNITAMLAEIPWVILISRKSGGDESNFGRFATGSLIHPKVVLTAVHSLNRQKADSLKAIAGDWDIQEYSEMKLLQTQERDVETIKKHEDFSKESLQNDVALLFLISPFELNYHIDIICLPPVDLENYGSQCTVTGWGN